MDLKKEDYIKKIETIRKFHLRVHPELAKIITLPPKSHLHFMSKYSVKCLYLSSEFKIKEYERNREYIFIKSIVDDLQGKIYEQYNFYLHNQIPHIKGDDIVIDDLMNLEDEDLVMILNLEDDATLKYIDFAIEDITLEYVAMCIKFVLARIKSKGYNTLEECFNSYEKKHFLQLIITVYICGIVNASPYGKCISEVFIDQQYIDISTATEFTDFLKTLNL